MKKFKVGIQLYGVRDAMAADFEGTLKKLSEMGYEYVEFAGYYGKSSKEIKDCLDKYNLKCVSVHQSIDFYDENPLDKIEYLKGFGVKYSVIPWYEKSLLSDKETLADTLEKFNKIGKLLSQNGMKLGYHNHDFEFDKIDGKYIHDYIFDGVKEEYIEPELDTCWVRYAGIMPQDKIGEFSGRVTLLHLKDFVCDNMSGGPVYDLIDSTGKGLGAKGSGNAFEFRPLGKGVQDFAAILDAAERAGTEIVIVEQDKTSLGLTELEAAKVSRDYLRDTFGI